MHLYGELRRRNVFKVSLAYAILSWLIVRVADLVLPAFNAPAWLMQAIVLGLVLMFPVMALLAWAFELTPAGFKPTADVDATQSITLQTGQRLNRIVLVLAGAAALFWSADRYLLPEELPEIVADVSYRQDLAVMPFEDLSEPGNTDRAFAFGLRRDLWTRLSRVTGLRLSGRRSVYAADSAGIDLRAPGGPLAAGATLSADITVAGADLQIALRLQDARTGEIFWDDRIGGETGATTVADLLSDAALAIADALDLPVSASVEAAIARGETDSNAALAAYYTAVMLQERPDANRDGAIGPLQRAVLLDPEFSAAWTLLAAAHLRRAEAAGDIDFAAERRAAATAVMRAVRLGDDSADTLAVVGWHMLVHNHDWAGAEAAFRDALQEQPMHATALRWYARLLSWQGNQHDAVVAARLATTSEPLSPETIAVLHEVLVNAAEWTDASAVAADLPAALRRDPDIAASVWIGHLRGRRFEDAAAALLNWAELRGADVEAAAEVGAHLIARLALGDDETFDLARIEDLGAGFDAAELYAVLGDADRTLATLEAALQANAGARALLSAGINPSYEFLADEPRFAALLAATGLD